MLLVAYNLVARWWLRRSPAIRVYPVLAQQQQIGRVIRVRTALWSNFWQAEAYALDEKGTLERQFPIYARCWDNKVFRSRRAAEADVRRVAGLIAERQPGLRDLTKLIPLTVDEYDPSTDIAAAIRGHMSGFESKMAELEEALLRDAETRG